MLVKRNQEKEEEGDSNMMSLGTVLPGIPVVPVSCFVGTKGPTSCCVPRPDVGQPPASESHGRTSGVLGQVPKLTSTEGSTCSEKRKL